MFKLDAGCMSSNVYITGDNLCTTFVHKRTQRTLHFGAPLLPKHASKSGGFTSMHFSSELTVDQAFLPARDPEHVYIYIYIYDVCFSDMTKGAVYGKKGDQRFELEPEPCYLAVSYYLGPVWPLV